MLTMAPSDEPIESRVAVLESRLGKLDTDFTSIVKKLDSTLEAVGEERREMAEQRGALKEAKWIIPSLCSLVGFLSGALVTLMAAHLL